MIVCHCYRASDSVIRIISARKADKNESNVLIQMASVASDPYNP